jgi:hypothetical protein
LWLKTARRGDRVKSVSPERGTDFLIGCAQRGSAKELVMRLTRRFVGSSAEILFLALVAAGCSGGKSPGGSPGTGGGEEETGGSATGGATGGKSGQGTGTGGSAGKPATPDAASEPAPDAGSDPAPDASTGTTPDATAAGTDAAPFPGGGMTPMSTDGGPPPSYAGEIPVYYGPEVGPIVQMNCPEDPTVGWTEYQDSFNVQRPYDKPINTRFSIVGGIYNFWVFPNDAPHSPTANGRNPRTEARYGGTADVATGKNFQHGNRLFSTDMLIEKNAVNSAIFQIHTTADGGGPIGIRVQSNGDIVNNGSLTVVKGSNIPGGTIDKWFNFKASLNADTQEVKIYINNCLQSTSTSSTASTFARPPRMAASATTRTSTSTRSSAPTGGDA